MTSTSARPEPGVVGVTSIAMFSNVNTGAAVSTTVTVTVSVSVPPLPSSTVRVNTCVPSGKIGVTTAPPSEPGSHV